MLCLFCELILAVSILYCLYQGVITLHMFKNPDKVHPSTDIIHRFAVIICARNEEGVISNLLDSLKNQNYPAGSFDIFVTADNCTDDTAELARRNGAYVYERFDTVHKGKGFALNWTFARFLPRYRGKYDACVIFDADNVADRDFLSAMNCQLNAGHDIAAGYRMGKNPSSSWVAGCSSIFWLMQTRMCFVPRARLNLPCFSVGGTGFMFALSVLGDEGWQTRSICEDIEFTLNSIAAGRFVSFAPDAIFYDEQPLRFSSSLRQRYRWSLGSIQLLTISTPRLFKALISGKKDVLDAFLYSLGTLITGISGVCGALLMALEILLTKNDAAILEATAVSLVYGFLTASLTACLVLLMEKRTWRGAWKAVLTYPIYLLSWGFINVLVLFYRNPQWKVIPHTENLSIEQVEGLQAK